CSASTTTGGGSRWSSRARKTGRPQFPRVLPCFAARSARGRRESGLILERGAGAPIPSGRGSADARDARLFQAIFRDRFVRGGAVRRRGRFGARWGQRGTLRLGDLAAVLVVQAGGPPRTAGSQRREVGAQPHRPLRP